MPITRTFLDWTQPALPAVAEFLLDEYGIPGRADLENVVVVLPGRRAGRRLLEILVTRCETSSLRLTPPLMETLGRLPELFYESKRPFAGELVQQLAWMRALQTVDRRRVQQVIPELPPDDDTDRWMALGRMLAAQHRELAGDGLNFEDVAKRGPDVNGFDEQNRWTILREIQETYLLTLDDLELWDQQTARLFAIQYEECRTEKQIVLVGTSDMNRVMRTMLDQISERVTALVHAPQRLAKRFDEHGCLLPQAWRNVPLAVETEQVRVVDSPAEQAEEVARVLAGFDGQFRADEITVGLADETLVPQVQRQLSQCDVPSRWVIGKSLPQTAPFQLLKAVGDYLADRRYRDFAALVRHRDLFAWITRQGIGSLEPEESANGECRSWLRELDEYHRRHLQPRLGDWIGSEESYAQIRAVHDCIDALLRPFAGGPQPLGDWTEPLVNLLLNVYSHVEFDREETADRVTISACKQIHATLVEQTALPESLSPQMTATDAIRLTLEQLQTGTIPAELDEQAVELLGWLELPLDDAPALIVTTFNEGHVPKSVNSDLFLPNRLRQHLGVVENDRRYARDAYALSVLLASRRELTLIVGRRDVNDDPLRPSRLLFAADEKTVANRVLAFFKPERQRARPPLQGALTATQDDSAFLIPRPEPLEEPIDRISVTAFRAYIACPYRFYLRHVLRLESVEDEPRELDAKLFGNLLHDVLNRFGNSDVRDSTEEKEIRDFLRNSLDACLKKSYGGVHVAAIDVQLMQMRMRLDAFAEWQARRTGEGWRITHTEVSLSQNSLRLPVDENRSVQLDGRIDRIDRFRDEDHWIIYDYKTGDSAKPPRKMHQNKEDWVDLQLPLYRRLAEQLGVKGRVELGYIVLPKDTDAVNHLIADWTPAELQAADDKAVEVARSILDGEFFPPAETSNVAEFTAICQEDVFDREVIA